MLTDALFIILDYMPDALCSSLLEGKKSMDEQHIISLLSTI